MNRSLMVALAMLATAPAWCQEVFRPTMTCNVVFSGSLQPPLLWTDFFAEKPPAVPFQFTAAEGEIIMVRLTVSDPTFDPDLVLTYQSGVKIPPRPGTIQYYRPNSRVPTPRTFEYFMDATGTFYFDVQLKRNTQIGGSFQVAMVRLNRPCPNAVLSCGSSAKGQLTGPMDMQVFAYTALANDIISFRFLKTAPKPGTAGATPTNLALFLFGPDGQIITAPEGGPAAFEQVVAPGFEAAVTVPSAGPVTALVFDRTGASASFAISATNLKGGRCIDNAPTCGQVLEGSVQDVVQTKRHLIPAAAGDAFTVKLARLDPNAQFAPLGKLYDPAGKLLSSLPPGSTPHGLSTQVLSASVAGDYLLVVGDTYDGTKTGDYAVSLNRINNPCTGQSVGCSTIVDGGIKGLLRQDTYLFNANANDSYLFRLLNTATDPSFKPRLDIYDSKGNPVANIAAQDLSRVNVTVPATGAYTVVVSDGFDGGGTGTYSLSSVRLNGPCEAAPLECGKVLTGSIDGPLRFGTFTYDATAGDSFTVRLLNPGGGLQPDIEIYDPRGQRVGTDIAANVRSLDVVRPVAGQYTVVANDSSKVPGRGPFAIDLLRTRNACGPGLPQATTTSGVVSGTAPFASYSFTAATGDLLNVRSASFTPGFSAVMELYDPAGARLDNGTFSLVRRAPSAGVYTLLVSGSDPRTVGRYSASWQALNNPVNAPSLFCGATATGSLSASNEFRYYLAGLRSGDSMKLLLTRTSDNFAPQAEVYDPSGTRIATTTGETVQRVRAEGNYMVIVAPTTASGETGGYSLALQRPNDPCNPTRLACGQTLLRSIDLAGQYDAITFQGAGGDVTSIRLPVRTGTLAPFAELYDGSGNLLRGSSTGTLAATLPGSGNYTVFVRDRNGPGTGTYRAGLQTDPACPVNDKEAPTLQIQRPTGGEVAAGGSTFRIAWQSDDNVDVASHEVRLSTDGGKTFPTVITGTLSGGAQSFDWAVPTAIAPSRTAVIQVTAADSAGNSRSAASDTITLIGSGFTESVNATLQYDTANRLIQAAYSNGLGLRYTYDASGNLVQITVTGQ